MMIIEWHLSPYMNEDLGNSGNHSNLSSEFYKKILRVGRGQERFIDFPTYHLHMLNKKERRQAAKFFPIHTGSSNLIDGRFYDCISINLVSASLSLLRKQRCCASHLLSEYCASTLHWND